VSEFLKPVIFDARSTGKSGINSHENLYAAWSNKLRIWMIFVKERQEADAKV
jgi:hypothetical protein